MSDKRKPIYSKDDYKNLIIEDIPKKDKPDNADSNYFNKDDNITSNRKTTVKAPVTTINRVKRVLLRISFFAVCLLVIILVVTQVMPKFQKTAYSQGYEVIINGTTVGITDAPEPVTKALTDIRALKTLIYDMKVFDNTELSYNPVNISQDFILPSSMFADMLNDSVKVKVMAWVITVNNTPAAALKTLEAANNVLNRLLEPFGNIDDNSQRFNIGFVENVEIKEIPIEFSQILEEDNAFMLMKFGGEIEEVYHTIVSKESLYSIAKLYGLKIADLRKANPLIATKNKIYKGDKLLITAPKNRANITYKEIIEKEDQPMKYESESVSDDTLYTSQRKTITQGLDGIYDYEAEITYINGVEVDKKILKQEVSVEPITEIIAKGTMPVPKVLKLAQSGKMPLPLNGSYSISSEFGPRDIDVPGASKWHKGIDIDAPTGTPIYASAAGTVSRSAFSSSYGKYIKIDHDGGVETRYAHCSQLIVKQGEKVDAGQLIALVGNSGTSGGPHVHFEIRINGIAQDPLDKYKGEVPD